MQLEIYKKGQGTLVRWAAYALCGMLVLFGARSFYASFNRPGKYELVHGLPLVGTLTVYNVLSILVAVGGLFALHLFLNRAKTADLLIETESEMRKVTWPTVREAWRATGVVTAVTLALAVILFGLDEVLRKLLFLILGNPGAGL